MTYHGGLATHKILILAPLAYNLSPTTPPVFSLPDHALVTLEGPDAMAFAHAQFANDVAALAPGCWQWNAWLTPKGRVIAVFALTAAWLRFRSGANWLDASFGGLAGAWSN